MIDSPLSILPPHQYSTVGPLAVRLSFWERYGTARRSLADWMASIALPRLPTASARYLDVGCGDGRTYLRVRRGLAPGATAVALDRSPAMVASACASPGANASGSGVAADVHWLPFLDATFDVVTCMHVLHHVADIPAAVDELARVVGPEGLLIVTTGDFDPASTLNRIHYEALESLSFPSFTTETSCYTRFDRTAAEGDLAGSFTSVRHIEYRNDAVCDDADALMAYYLSGMMFRQTTGRTDQRIPTERWDELEAAVRARIDAEIGVSGSLLVEGTVHCFLCSEPRSRRRR